MSLTRGVLIHVLVIGTSWWMVYEDAKTKGLSYTSTEKNTFTLMLRGGFAVFLWTLILQLVLDAPYVLLEGFAQNAFRRYKLQPKVVNDYSSLVTAGLRVLKDMFVVSLPLSVVSMVVLRRVVDFDWVALDVYSLAVQMVLYVVVQDTAFYPIHRLLHTPKFFWIHKVHHTYTAPHALAAEYAHPLETIFGFTLPIFIGFAGVATICPINITLILIGMLHSVIRSVEGHSGYHMPYQLGYWKWLSWYNGGAPHHDLHHKLFDYNYGAWWQDWAFGTLRSA